MFASHCSWGCRHLCVQNISQTWHKAGTFWWLLYFCIICRPISSIMQTSYPEPGRFIAVFIWKGQGFESCWGWDGVNWRVEGKYFELTYFESVWPDNSGDLSTGHVFCIPFKMFQCFLYKCMVNPLEPDQIATIVFTFRSPAARGPDLDCWFSRTFRTLPREASPFFFASSCSFLGMATKYRPAKPGVLWRSPPPLMCSFKRWPAPKSWAHEPIRMLSEFAPRSANSRPSRKAFQANVE